LARQSVEGWASGGCDPRCKGQSHLQLARSCLRCTCRPSSRAPGRSDGRRVCQRGDPPSTCHPLSCLAGPPTRLTYSSFGRIGGWPAGRLFIVRTFWVRASGRSGFRADNSAALRAPRWNNPWMYCLPAPAGSLDQQCCSDGRGTAFNLRGRFSGAVRSVS